MQVIPHVTNEIKYRICFDLKNIDFLIVEVGGTVGDIESLPFLEASKNGKLSISPTVPPTSTIRKSMFFKSKQILYFISFVT